MIAARNIRDPIKFILPMEGAGILLVHESNYISIFNHNLEIESSTKIVPDTDIIGHVAADGSRFVISTETGKLIQCQFDEISKFIEFNFINNNIYNYRINSLKLVGFHIIIGTASGELILIDFQTTDLIGFYQVNRKPVSGLFPLAVNSANLQRILISFNDRENLLFDVPTQQLVGVPKWLENGRIEFCKLGQDEYSTPPESGFDSGVISINNRVYFFNSSPENVSIIRQIGEIDRMEL